jgi:hypothetical protein
MKKIFFIVFFGGLFLFPLVTLAGEYNIEACTDGNSNGICDIGEPTSSAVASYDGLVPCGKCVSVSPPLDTRPIDEAQCGAPPGTTDTKYISCTLCHFFIMIEGIIDFILFQIIPPVAILMIVVGAAMFILGRGNPSTVAQGKTVMTSVAIGLIIIFAAWAIINTLLMLLDLSQFAINLGVGPSEWGNINCSILIPG